MKLMGVSFMFKTVDIQSAFVPVIVISENIYSEIKYGVDIK